MIIRQLSLVNFMGYRKKCYLDFTGRQTIGICGANESGKSTILQAISYALYGRTLAERELQLISDDATGDLVVECVVCMPDGSEFEIVRGRTRANEPILRLSGYGGKSSDVAAAIQNRIKLSYQDFVGLTYFVQGDLHQFMDGNKREYFQRWAQGLALWGDFESKAKAEVTKAENSLRSLQSGLNDAQDQLSRKGDVETRLRGADVALATAEQKADGAQDSVVELKAKIKASDGLRQARREAQQILDRVTSLNHQVASIRKRIRDLESELGGVADGICPLLNIKCADLAITEKAATKEIKRKLRIEKSDLKQVTDQRSVEETRLTETKDKIRELSDLDLRHDLAVAENTASIANRLLRQAQQDKERLLLEMQAIEGAEARISEIERQIETSETDLRQWQFVRFMCSKGGIPSILIERELQEVEDRCNWIFERLDYPKRIRFSGHKELQGFEKICTVCGSGGWTKQVCRQCGADRPRKRKEDPTVTILDGRNERPFALESGGAKVLQSFAVRLAGSQFVSSMTGIPMQMIMLDEVFGMLDSENRQKLIGLVVSRLSDQFGLRQQFVVSHQEDVVSAVDDMLIVTRQNGSSVARWG